MGRQKRKGEAGAAKAFITRKKAMKKLQLSLKDFRRLCILKGIYPVEPRHKSKLGSGGVNKTYYLLADVQYLSHEPIIWKFWEFKIFMRRLAKAKGRQDYHVADRIRDNEPFYKLNHVVKERYPTMVDALRDLDDGLSMCCLYAKLPKDKLAPAPLVNWSRRLGIEFMHYIAEARALRKVFVSVKGYYYQAEVMGQAITWVVPHEFVFEKAQEVDYKVLSTFTEFYITLLGFINFKLFASLNLCYPPRVASTLSKQDAELLAGEDESVLEQEYIAALSRPLVKTKIDDETEQKIDEFEENKDEQGEELKSCIGLTFKQTMQLQKLFEGLVFFINREVPREALVFVIRSFGGSVSWCKTTFIGSTYDENDTAITHHIIDREHIPNKYMNRSYVQPQWVFDCVNARRLLNVQDYFPGVPLPPHLSPFVEVAEGDYVSPEAERLRQLQSATQDAGEEEEEDDDDDEGVEADEGEDEEDVDDEEPDELDEDSDPAPAKQQQQRKRKQIEVEEPVLKKKSKERPPKPEVVDEVRPGKAKRIANEKQQKQQMDAEEKRLAVMMMPKRKKRLYDKIMYGKRRQVREAATLKAKREQFEKSQLNSNKKKKKSAAT